MQKQSQGSKWGPGEEEPLYPAGLSASSAACTSAMLERQWEGRRGHVIKSAMPRDSVCTRPLPVGSLPDLDQRFAAFTFPRKIRQVLQSAFRCGSGVQELYTIKSYYCGNTQSARTTSN